MNEISLDDVAQGQVVAADVADADGRTILFAGTVLTPSLISSLRRRGIETIRVQPSAIHKPAPPPEGEDLSDKQARTYTDFLFRHCDRELAVVVALYDIALLKQQSARKFKSPWPQ